jgi:uncharacterized protein (TIGR00251 family)
LSAAARPWRVDAEGVVLAVRLTPRGGRDAIDGVEQLADGRHILKVRVRAVPSAGAANSALTALIAAALGVARGDVSLVAGAGARLKRLRIEGDGPALAAALERLCQAA